ncbi:hypothetical protein D3C72_2038720 [compost metagenome]
MAQLTNAVQAPVGIGHQYLMQTMVKLMEQFAQVLVAYLHPPWLVVTKQGCDRSRQSTIGINMSIANGK